MGVHWVYPHMFPEIVMLSCFSATLQPHSQALCNSRGGPAPCPLATSPDMPISEACKAQNAGKRAAKKASVSATVALVHALDQKPLALKENIMKHLEMHPDELEPCWAMLEQGFCDPKKMKQNLDDPKDRIPTSATTINSISAKVIKDTLYHMHPDVFSMTLLAKLRKDGKKHLTNLFCFCVQELPGAPTPSHDLSVFKEVYKARYEQLGNRGNLLTIMNDDICWGTSGTYHLEKTEGKYTHIVHASGTKAGCAKICDDFWSFI